MPNDPNQKDLRVIKTNKALFEAMFSMLNYRNFNSITVNDLCIEALVSRASFYAHFRDKYDLLNYFLTEVRASIIKDVYKYDELEREINLFVNENKKLVTNILRDANSETMALVRNFMSAIVNLSVKRKTQNESSLSHIVLFNFFIGGLVNLLTWIMENNYPSEIKMMNTYLYKMLQTLTDWDAAEELTEAST